MSEESKSKNFINTNRSSKNLRTIRKEIKESTLLDLQVLTNQLASEYNKIRKSVEIVKKESIAS